MADIKDEISMDNFSIQSTMEMGAGNQELLNDLYLPETATAAPEDLAPIIKEAEPTPPIKATDKPKGKEVAPPALALGENDDEKVKAQSAIANFMGTGEDDEEEEEIITQKEPEEGEEQEEGTTQFTALSNDLYKLGVFTSEEDEDEEAISTPEQFLEKFNSEKKKGATDMLENFLSQFGEDYRNAFDAVFVKGVSPKEYFSVYNQVVSFAEMNLSDEQNQMAIMKQALTDQGFDSEDIDSEVDRLKNYGDLESVATKHHKVLVKKEAAKLQQMEASAEQELQQKAHIRNQYIKNVQDVLQEKLKTKEFDGIPLNPKIAGELQDFLLVDKWKTSSGETLSDFDKTILDLKRPENHATKVKVALLLKILEKDPSLSTIQNNGVTKKTNALFGEVARQVTKTKTGSSNTKSPSWFNNL